MRWNKKGALELSITAIVVLIIAITVLSFAIMFIKNLFGETGKIFPSEIAKIKEQLRKNLEESGELVVLDRGTELEVKRGERFEFHIGARNTASEARCFRIGVICKNSFTKDTCINDKKDLLVGGKDDVGDIPLTGENWFPRLLSQFEVPAGDIAVSPATLQIASASPDTYLMEMKIYQGNNDCTNVDWGSSETTQQTKRFHVILS